MRSTSCLSFSAPRAPWHDPPRRPCHPVDASPKTPAGRRDAEDTRWPSKFSHQARNADKPRGEDYALVALFKRDAAGSLRALQRKHALLSHGTNGLIDQTRRGAHNTLVWLVAARRPPLYRYTHSLREDGVRGRTYKWSKRLSLLRNGRIKSLDEEKITRTRQLGVVWFDDVAPLLFRNPTKNDMRL